MFFTPPSPVLLPVPHQQQRQQSDCLVACAQMVCRYWGVPISYSQLADLLQTVPDFGTPFSNLTRLQRYNLRVRVGSGTLKEMYEFLQNRHPLIAAVQTAELPYWENERTQHAVVVVGMTPTQVLLNDPVVASAPLGIALGDFDLAWLAQDEEFALITPA